jgi:hypothetical protein
MPVTAPAAGGATPAQSAAAAAAGTALVTPPVDYSSASSLEAAATAGVTPNVTQAIWATFLLLEINASGKETDGRTVPITLNNIQNIERWMVAEEPSSDWFDRNNPLNASLGTGSSDGTGSYANLSVAAQETAAMLTQSNMSGILDALQGDEPPATFSAAVVQSPWASSHYGVAAAGAPAKYVQLGRTVTYISSIPLPAQVSAGSGAEVLPADPGAATPESDGLPSLPSWADGLATLLGSLDSAAFWKRIGVFAGGGALVALGLVIFISTTKPGQQVQSSAPDLALLAAA